MVFKQLRRYYCSSFSIILGVIFSIITGVGYYFIYSNNRWLFELLESGATDFNKEFVRQLVESLGHGIFYFENLFHSGTGEFAFLFWNIAIISLGVFLGAQTFTDIQSNYGTMVMTRMSYPKYLFQTLVAQSLYIFSYILGFFVIVLLLSMTLIGGGLTVPVGSTMADHSLLLYLIKLFAPIFLGLLYTIPTILIASVSAVFIRNKQVLQMIPFLYVIGTPFIHSIFFQLRIPYVGFLMVQNSIFGLSQWLLFDLNFWDWTWMILIYPVLAFLIFSMLYRFNLQKFSKEYLA